VTLGVDLCRAVRKLFIATGGSAKLFSKKSPRMAENSLVGLRLFRETVPRSAVLAAATHEMSSWSEMVL